MRDLLSTAILISVLFTESLVNAQSISFKQSYSSKVSTSVFMSKFCNHQTGDVLVFQNYNSTSSTGHDIVSTNAPYVKMLNQGKEIKTSDISIPGNFTVTEIIPYSESEHILTGFIKTDISDKHLWSGKNLKSYHIQKLDSSGRIKWDLNVQGDIESADKIVCRMNNDYLLTAIPFRGQLSIKDQELSSSNHSVDVLLLLTDTDGAIKKFNCFNGIGDEFINHICFNQNGFYLAMHFSHDLKYNAVNLNSNGRNDGLYIHLNQDLEIEHYRQIGSIYDDRLTTLSTDMENNIILCGTYSAAIHDTDLFLTAPAGSLDGFVVKINSSNEVLWIQNLGSSANVHIQSVIVTLDNSICLSGHFRGEIRLNHHYVKSTGFTNDIYVLKILPEGFIENIELIDNQGEDFLGNLLYDKQGTIWLGGNTSRFFTIHADDISDTGHSGYFIKKVLIQNERLEQKTGVGVNANQTEETELNTLKYHTIPESNNFNHLKTETQTSSSSVSIKMFSYPNPFTDQCTILLSSDQPLGKLEIVIINLTGREVWKGFVNTGMLNASLTVPTETFSSGNYTTLLIKNHDITDKIHLVKL